MRIVFTLVALICSAAFLLSGCSSSQGNSDTRVVVGTFNTEWLGDGVDDLKPRSDQDYLLMADIIAKTGADVLALEEVENQAALQKVLRYMADYQGVVCETGGRQRVGLVYKKTVVVRVLRDYTPLQLDRPDILRPGLLVECSKGAFSWIQLCVHLKSTSRYDSTTTLVELSRQLRSRQAEVIKSFIDSVVAAGSESDVLVTGDFNDYPARKSNPTLMALSDNQYVFLTEGLKSCKNPKWDTIDHVVASQSAASRAIPGSARMENIHDFLSTEDSDKVSDHCPVVVSFSCTP